MMIFSRLTTTSPTKARAWRLQTFGSCFAWSPAGADAASFANPHYAALLERGCSLLERYGARVRSYDVVNEAVDPATGELRQTSLSRAMGSAEAVLDFAFTTARARAPWAELAYDNYMSWEAGNERHRAGVLRLLEGFRKRGTPVDALGVQSHIGVFDATPSVAQLVTQLTPEWRRFLDAVHGHGLSPGHHRIRRARPRLAGRRRHARLLLRHRPPVQAALHRDRGSARRRPRPAAASGLIRQERSVVERRTTPGNIASRHRAGRGLGQAHPAAAPRRRRPRLLERALVGRRGSSDPARQSRRRAARRAAARADPHHHRAKLWDRNVVATERTGTPFWRDRKTMEVLERLAEKMRVYAANGRGFCENEKMFNDISWFAVMWGQLLRPAACDPVADTISLDQTRARIAEIERAVADPADYMPKHRDFIREHRAAA